jgi:hypothetical protein
VAQLSIALAIFVGALLWIYAVERIWFRQQRARAIGITFLVAGSDPAVGLILFPRCAANHFWSTRSEDNAVDDVPKTGLFRGTLAWAKQIICFPQ